MIDLGREIQAAVRVDWDDERLAKVRAGVEPRRRRRNAMRAAIGGVATIAIVIAGWLAWPDRAPRVAPALPIQALAPSQMLRFADGSTATHLGTDSVLREVPLAIGRPEFDLTRVAARFDVIEDRTRVFRVASGSVKVEAFGAVFACAVAGQQLHVEVFRGELRVLWNDQQRELTAGEQGVFPPIAVPVPVPAAPIAPPARVAPPARSAAKPAVASSGWRELAHDGDFDHAYKALTDSDAVRDEPEELLLAADVKRLSHHPAEAIEPLRAIVRDHAADPRAPLAAFTLGRVLLEELGRPAEAADAFADAVRLAPTGPMTEDAIAREVEALSRAGESLAAKQLAQHYLEQFPTGRKLKSVRRFGGIE
jgi:transmembrane sensor